MKVTSRTRRMTRWQNIVFVVLLLAVVGLLGWLSARYNYEADWTAGGRRSLSEASVMLLGKLEGPVTVTAYAREATEQRQPIRDMIARYQRYKSDLALRFVDPDAEPARAREQGISTDGELVLEYQQRSERIKPFELAEQHLTNALQRLARGGERWLVFIEGHGERRAQGQANHDLSAWARELESKGYQTRVMNLAETAVIPDNTTVLVIAGPQVDWLPGEVQALRDYVQRGGNLLWLSDPGSLHGLESIAEQLGVRFHNGIVVDLTSQALGIQSPAIAAVTNYIPHPITRDFALLSVFPVAAGLEVKSPEGWRAEPFLITNENSWVESSDLAGAIAFDADSGDVRGPVTIGVSLSRALADGEQEAAASQVGASQQRVVVIGDGDFLSNRYLGNVGNLDLGMNMVSWLARDDSFINIPAKTAPDVALTLTPVMVALIGYGFLLGVPALLLGTGLVIWWRRRKR